MSTIAGLTVDLAYAIHNLYKEVKARIDAAEHLPNTCRRCVRLIDQIDGMVMGNVDDKRTRTILENISSCMEELDDLIDRMIKLGATKQGGGGVCICLNVASAGKDAMKVEDDLERTEEELRKHLDSLVQATQLHTYSTRTSNKLEQVDSRRFWDEHFGDMREVSVKAIAEALNHECETKNLGVDTATVVQLTKDCFSGKETVTVLGFGEVFNKASIPDTMVSLAKRAGAKTSLLAIKVYNFESKTVDQNLYPGFVMCKDTDSLRVFRSLVMTHAMTLADEESSSDDSEFDFDGEESKRLARRQVQGEGHRRGPRRAAAGVPLPRRGRVHVLPGRLRDEGSAQTGEEHVGDGHPAEGLHRPRRRPPEELRPQRRRRAGSPGSPRRRRRRIPRGKRVRRARPRRATTTPTGGGADAEDVAQSIMQRRRRRLPRETA